MGRGELERLSKAELIEVVLRLQRPEKTSRTSSKLPLTDHKEPREKSKPGAPSPALSDRADRVVDPRPEPCPCGRAALGPLWGWI
jgi:transposase